MARDKEGPEGGEVIPSDPHDQQDPDRVGINPESETSGETMAKDVESDRRKSEDSVTEHATRTHEREAKLAEVDPDYRISPSSQSTEEAQQATDARPATQPKPVPPREDDPDRTRR